MKGHPFSSIAGKITFKQKGLGVLINGMIMGLSRRDRYHGMAILENTTCPPFEQFPIDSHYLNHYNPLGYIHGHPDSQNKHLGDLGNIFVNFDGTSNFEFSSSTLSLVDGLYTITNRTIVIMEKEDDFGMHYANPESVWTGDSGPAIACGVISLL
jgi:Cu-Zn family superoxide dismutase